MKFLLSFLFVYVCSCNTSPVKKQRPAQTPVPDSLQILQTSAGGMINLIGNHVVTDTINNYILFPLQVQDAKDKEESARMYSKEGPSAAMYWNIIFHDYRTGEHRLLEPEKKILIGGYDYDHSSYYSDVDYSAGRVETHKQTPYIFYSVYADDYNGDKKLGTSDPAYFYISNADGTGFKQVSPAGISITGKTFPKNNAILLMSGLRDSNNDKRFDEKDEQVYYKVNMADPLLKTEEIFSQAFKLSLKKLFDKHWKLQ